MGHEDSLPDKHRSWIYRLFVADGLATTGEALTAVAWPLLAIVSLHASAFEVAILLAVEQLPWLVIGVPAGVIVDRLNRRTVLILGTLIRAVLFTSVPCAYILGILSIAQLFVVAGLSGLSAVFTAIASDAMIPALTEKTGLVKANSTLMTVRTATDFGGSSIAGLLISALSAPITIAIDSLLCLITAVLFGTLPRDRAGAENQPASFLQEALEGLRFTLGQRLFRQLIGATCLSNFATAAQYGLIFSFLSRDLKLPASAVGVVFATASLGGLVGSAALGPLSSRLKSNHIWKWCVNIGPLFGILVPLAVPGPGVALFVLGYFTTNAASAVVNIISSSTRQALTPAHLLGRLSASITFFTWGVIPVGLAVGGVLSSALGVRSALWVVAIIAFGPIFILIRSSIWADDDFDESVFTNQNP